MRTVAGCLAAGLLFSAIWLAVHPPLPQLPSGDVYTALATARHLSRGDGLLNDAVYPMFTSYTWGCEVPQPLLHRGPGLAVVLLPAWVLSGGDPMRAEALVRPVMLTVLCLLVMLGTLGLWRRGSSAAAGAWLILLIFNPMLALAASWGWTEVPAALLLLGLWIILRRQRGPASFSLRAAAGTAALAAFLALVRQELLWVPALWWIASALAAAATHKHRHSRPSNVVLLRRTALALLLGAALMAPWWLHVARHTGSPLTNPLTDAVQLDLSIEWWQYPLLRGRTPLPLTQNLAENTGPALRKVRSGIRHYTETLGNWLPWLGWVSLIILLAAQARRRSRLGYRWFVTVGPPGLLIATLGLMVLQYAFFSLETRHMLPLLPLFTWELCLLADRALRRAPCPWLWRPMRKLFCRSIVLATFAGVTTILTPPSLGGEAHNVAQALGSAARVAEVTAAAADLPPGPVFSDSAVVPWRLGRAFVWSPFDETIETEIRLAIPAMRNAPYLRLQPPSPAVDGEY